MRKPLSTDQTALFTPSDTRHPQFIVPIRLVPEDWIERYEAYADSRFAVQFDRWDEKISFPFAKTLTVLK